MVVSHTFEIPELSALRNRVKRVFYHAFNGYLRYAYPLDELRPLTCDGQDTWGSFSLTLVDSLDTLVVLGNNTEFIRVVNILLKQLNPNKDVNVSVFETNIRVVGGLLSAHLLSRKAGMQVDYGWPCHGKLLQLAESFASKLLPAFNTPTGLPYGTVNLAHGGVPKNETPVTCVATIGTTILEFGALSRLTGDSRYEEVAMRALRSLWMHRSNLGLVGNHINVITGEWIGSEATIGAGVDSYFEYLVKGSILFQLPELDAMFQDYFLAIKEHIKFDNWHFTVDKDTGNIIFPHFQSLESFWAGTLAMTGRIQESIEYLVTYQSIWKKYGFLPEFYDVGNRTPFRERTAYPLRPEFIESTWYLYRATKDPYFLRIGAEILTSIETVARTRCGFATIADVRTHDLENRMESFFLSETTKYLYLLFDPDNFLNKLLPDVQEDIPDNYNVLNTLGDERCEMHSGGYIFNTEAHPLDGGLIHCCSAHRVREMRQTAHLQTSFPPSVGLHSDLSNLLIDEKSPKKSSEIPGKFKPFEIALLDLIDDAWKNMPTSSQETAKHCNKIDSKCSNFDKKPDISVDPDAWLTTFFKDLTSPLLLTHDNSYPLNYEPPNLRRNRPLLSCPVIQFTGYLKSAEYLSHLYKNKF